VTLLERAVVEIAAALESMKIDYMIIGGVANAIWGEPRATIDVDVTVAVENPDLAAAIAGLVRSFKAAVPDPEPFVRRTRVLPLNTTDGIRIDVIFALMSFEREAVGRATAMTFGDRQVRIITPEDLVLMKIISDRPRDLADAEALVRRRADTLDRTYLEPRIREFAESLEMPEILARWKRWVEAD
jgi:Nucleotidyl transferase AbiEii toxin, Type IV TA system